MHLNSFLNYLKLEKRFSESTLVAYQTDIQQFINFLQIQYEITLENTPIQATFIRSFLVQQLSNGCTSSTIHRKLSSLKSLFKFLQKRNLINNNPTLNLRPPKKGKPLPTFIEESKLTHLLENVEIGTTFEDIRNKLIIELLYSTGMRRSELINLQINDIDLTQQFLKITGKGKKQRVIPFGNNLQTQITHYLQLKNQQNNPSPYLFISPSGTKMYDKLVYRIVTQYLKIISTQKHKSPHVLRHSFASTLLNNGADLNAIKQLLGHANLQATQIYTHTDFEKIKEIYKKSHPKSK